MEQIRSFGGGLNTDDSVEVMSPEDFQFASNFISGRSDMSQNGGNELLRGTTVINTGSFTDSNSTCIGVLRVVADNVHYLFFHNTDPLKNCILKLDNDVVTNVITWTGLNFDLVYRINGGGVAGNLLYFTDNNNQPRCVHLTRYISTPPSAEEEILLIKRGPQLPPVFRKYEYGVETAEYTQASLTSSTVVVSETIDPTTPQTGVIVLGEIGLGGAGFVYTSWTGSTFTVVDDPTSFTFSTVVTVRAEVNSSNINHYAFQFAYYYEYVDKQISVLSPYSRLCSPSVNDEEYRRVEVEIPSDELYPELVSEIVIVARINNSGSFFEISRIGVLDSRITNFYNDTNGNTIDPFQSLPFSLVPQKAGSMAISKSRMWLGNILEGYDTSGPIDLTHSLNIELPSGGDASSFTVYRLIKNVYTEGPPDAYGFTTYELVSNEVIFFDTTYQYIILQGDEFSVLENFDPLTWDTGDLPLTLHATGLFRASYPNSYNAMSGEYTEYLWQKYVDVPSPLAGYTVPVILTTTPNQFVGQKTFPQDSTYLLGVVFADGQGRTNGVMSDSSFRFSTPNYVTDKIQLSWTLNSDTNIPTWARYYSIVMTKNLKKSWYIDYHSIDISYWKQLAGDTESTTYIAAESKDYSNVRINIRNFILSDLSYSFIEGDRVIIRDVNGSDYDLRLTGFDGSFLNCEKGDLNETLTEGAYNSIEIYRPIQTGLSDPIFYETGHIYRVDRTELGVPYFSVTDGIIEGDSIVVIRDIYDVIAGEATDEGTDHTYKSISVDSDQTWNTDRGRPFIKLDVGQTLKESYFRHSATYIGLTSINGLSDFDAGDEGNIPIESGPVMKLQPTSKESTEGDVILAIGKSDTYSIYIDEARLATGAGSFMVGATNIIGDVRKQKSGYGTLHPECVFEEDGNVFFYDKLSRSFCRYATNGIFPISEYKVSKYFEDISALNSEDDLVVSGYDPFYKVVFCTFTNAATTVKKTIGFSLIKERWIGYINFAPEAYLSGSDSMYTVKDGVIYKHNDTVNYNRFYGVDYNASIECSFNDAPDKPKDWRALAIGCSPNLYSFVGGNQVVITNGLRVDVTNRHNQATSILYNEMEVDENGVYCEIRGDENTGTVLTGDPIYSNTAQCKITMTYGTNKYLLFAKAGFELSKGHSL